MIDWQPIPADMSGEPFDGSEYLLVVQLDVTPKVPAALGWPLDEWAFYIGCWDASAQMWRTTEDDWGSEPRCLDRDDPVAFSRLNPPDRGG